MVSVPSGRSRTRSSEPRGSRCRLRLCTASRDRSRIGAPSAAGATATYDAKGPPDSSRVASAAVRTPRIKLRASAPLVAESASISISPQAFSETLATFCSHSVTKARRRGCGRGANDSKGAGMPTIALVDDDRNILTSVSMTLETEGYRVQTYNDGSSALDGLTQNPPDLAILDIKMPRMDGMELLRKLRQGSDMPVIFLTS